MTAGKGQRLATAVGFLAGMYACLHVLRDVRVVWPPDALWSALAHQQRVELVGGIALIVVSVVIALRRPTAER